MEVKGLHCVVWKITLKYAVISRVDLLVSVMAFLAKLCITINQTLSTRADLQNNQFITTLKVLKNVY